MKIAPSIIIDSREQQPWKFENLPTETGTLDTGDYSIRGLEHLVAVERKSLPDLLACCGRHRDRFKRELQRLRGYEFRLLVVEADGAEIERGAWRSQLRPKHVMGSLAAWTAQYVLPVWLGGDHKAAARFAERFLDQSAREIARRYEIAGQLASEMESERANVR